MSSESFVTFDRDLERGFDMVRPEDGAVGTMPGEMANYSAKAVKDDEVDLAPFVVADATFFTE